MRKKLFLTIVGMLLTLILVNTPNVLATSSTTYVNLSDENITVNGSAISENISENIYLSNSTNNGGTTNEAKEANVEIENIINISKSGTYEFTGELSEGQISVNANEINGDVIIVLNNATITCKKAPAIIVYNKETKSDTCNVVIKTAKDSTNTISGSRLKQNVEGWTDQDQIVYYIEKGYDEGEYFEKYKYNGAISSDISLTLEGEGTLTVNSLQKEGIETKRDITINSGEYIINSLDDGINACTDNESVITINGGSVLVNVLEEAEEGDGIDSNGYIYINGGTVYAFASETSQDNGVDSDSGIYINGGTVVATGNMVDSVSTDSSQEFMQLQFKSKVSKNELITITDENKEPIIAFKTDRQYSVLTISSPDFTDEEHFVYEGGSIEGTNENGLYTKITSYTLGTEKEYNTVLDMERPDNLNKDIVNIGVKNNIYYYTIIVLAIILIILIIVAIILKKKGKFDMKGKILTLFIGILIGAIVATTGFIIYNNVTRGNQKMMVEQMPDGMQMPGGEKPDGEIPEKPEGEGGETRPQKPSQDQNSSNNA